MSLIARTVKISENGEEIRIFVYLLFWLFCTNSMPAAIVGYFCVFFPK